MNAVFATVVSIFAASWNVLLESAPWMLFGFFVAGLFRAFLPADFIAKHLGGNGLSGILKASAFGVPVPLCSCGVLPAAAGLKERGAGKGPVASFLVSTPETGVDSMAVTYALLDPLMTAVRPVVSFFTAIAAGVAVSFSERFGKQGPARESGVATRACSGSSCGCGGGKTPSRENAVVKFRGGMAFAFGELLGDIGRWFLFGVLLAGCIAVLVPPDMMAGLAGNEYLSMIAMLAVAVPLYVCATASTPIAAALALKGISPGAALVFLLAGPATNIASLTVVSRLLGKRATGVYLLVIIVMSLAAGVLVNHLYGYLGLDITGWVRSGMHQENGIVPVVSALLLLALTTRAVFQGKG